MRVLCYAQGLGGVGHFVRMLAIARGLGAGGHEVHLVDGGRAVPHRPGPFDPSLLRLPRLVRVGRHVAADGSGLAVSDMIAERTRRLGEAAARIRPAVVLVDHYPFGRWELEAEIVAMIAAARRADPGVRVVCSVRDNLQSNYRPAERAAFEDGVLARLASCFDEMLIHADPSFARLEESFARAGEIALPRSYTGFVVDRPAGAPGVALPPPPYAVVSCGGTITNLAYLLAVVEACRRLHARSAPGAMPLLVFPGPIDGGDAARLRAATGSGPFQVFGFFPDFQDVLAGAALSISRAGYNTCAQILGAGIPSVLVPNPDNADQAPRARRLAELGLATLVEGDPPDVEALVDAVAATIARPPKGRPLDFDGVATTRALLERPSTAARVPIG